MDNKVRKTVERQKLHDNEPSTLAELFIYAAEKLNRPDALNFKENGKWNSISTRSMLTRAEHIALGLHSLGIEKGDKVAILASNSPSWTIADAGCQIAGIVDVPIYTTLAPESIKYIVNDSGARAIFIENTELFEYVEGILPDLNQLEAIVLFEESGVESENTYSLATLESIGESKREESPRLCAEMVESNKPDDIATLIYTSGTTGEPKGVMLSHENLLSNAIDAGEKYDFSPADVPLSVLPLSHVFERTGMYLYIFNGMAVHYAESIEKVPENLKEVRPTIFVGVPRIFEKVYAKAKLQAALKSRVKESIFDWAISVSKVGASLREDKKTLPIGLKFKYRLADRLVFSKLRDFFGGRLRFCITGGAALSDTIYLIFMGAGIPIMQGYGLTETSPVISSNNPINVKLGSVGKPIRNVSVRIAEDGEVETVGPNVMLGYYNKPEATNRVFTEDGWFKTGDIGEIDDDGFLRITDRKKELFKTSGGKYVAPSPIEQMIKGSRFVNQVVLVGNGRKFVSALIVPNFEQLDSYMELKGIEVSNPDAICNHPRIISLFERQVQKHCAGLARFETVKKIALLPNELTVGSGELTPTLKVKRRVVDEKYRKIVDGIYELAEKENPAS